MYVGFSLGLHRENVILAIDEFNAAYNPTMLKSMAKQWVSGTDEGLNKAMFVLKYCRLVHFIKSFCIYLYCRLSRITSVLFNTRR